MDFHGRVVVVTGGTSGIGEACVREFHKLGAQVVLIGRDPAKADEIIASLGGGERLTAILGDVGESEFCAGAVSRVVERFGHVDVLVNSAAIMRRGDVFDLTDEDWSESFRVNVSGTFFMCREAIAVMKRNGGGAIVNVASDWGLVGGKGHVAYCATKGAVINMTRALALDHARDGIRINAICPGEVRTPMLASGLERRGFTPETGFEEMGKTIPIGRISEPEEQARSIRFLASDDASYMTGAILSVDGGSTTH
ncbi:NAD(P)-dependent dehydrogenase (short-subunit alcohol dehydrogenase family) [Rhodoligotrophos appendicifer]|uniref:SDR family NAD(P)-dependent oxidoreductase n=1 Tax=Rhodoligotrophos appendicifer TaxID=987056 RepID=UPI0011858AFD|nr:SDR family oxidoreductase [Rhodoligotrophos appendicifer]